MGIAEYLLAALVLDAVEWLESDDQEESDDVEQVERETVDGATDAEVRRAIEPVADQLEDVEGGGRS